MGKDKALSSLYNSYRLRRCLYRASVGSGRLKVMFNSAELKELKGAALLGGVNFNPLNISARIISEVIMSKNTPFFALHDDLIEVLLMVSETEGFKFAQGMDDERLPLVYESALDIPRLSVSRYGDQVHEERYLLIPKDATPVPRKVVMNDGRIKNFLNSGSQPSCLCLIPGGLYSKGNSVIAGDVIVLKPDAWSDKVYKAFRKAFTKKFKKVNGVFVGAQAYEKFKEGYRLNASVTAPLFTDLAERSS